MVETLKKNPLSLVGALVLIVGAAALTGYLLTHTTAEARETQAAAGSSSPAADAADDAKDVPPVPVEVVTLAAGPVASYISATANLVPEDLVTVLAETEGRVARLAVDEGDRVAAGQVIAVLARDEAEITLKKVELKAANALAAAERARDTLAQGLISEEAFDRLIMEEAVTRQEVAEAQWQLERTTIRAPFTGRVTERFITVGQHLRPGDRLVTVADFEPLVARIYLPERDVLALSVGQDARIAVAADSSLSFAGRIQRIAPTVDTATGTVKVTVEAVAPPAAVRPGAFVAVDIVREERTAAVLVPRDAVIRELRSAHVFVVDHDAAVKRPVELGLEEKGMIEARSGLAAGDAVVVAGHGSLEDGQKVKVLSS